MSNLGYQISKWASRNVKFAQLMLFFTTTSSTIMAAFLGSKLPIKFDHNEITILIIIGVSLVYSIERYGKSFIQNFKSVRQLGAIVSFCTYMMAFLIGNTFNTSFNNGTTKSALAVEIKTQHPNLLEETKGKIATKKAKKVNKELKSDTGLKLAYVALFLLSIGLSILSIYLFCSLACAGYGFFAVLTLLLGHGVLSGGFYFLFKAFEKSPVKRFKEMTKSERKKEWAKYVKIVLILLGVYGLIAFFQYLLNIF